MVNFQQVAGVKVNGTNASMSAAPFKLARAGGRPAQISRGRATAARLAHNQEVAGSIPAPATKLRGRTMSLTDRVRRPACTSSRMAGSDADARKLVPSGTQQPLNASGYPGPSVECAHAGHGKPFDTATDPGAARLEPEMSARPASLHPLTRESAPGGGRVALLMPNAGGRTGSRASAVCVPSAAGGGTTLTPTTRVAPQMMTSLLTGRGASRVPALFRGAGQ